MRDGGMAQRVECLPRKHKAVKFKYNRENSMKRQYLQIVFGKVQYLKCIYKNNTLETADVDDIAAWLIL
jgi:hypothetical protein